MFNLHLSKKHHLEILVFFAGLLIYLGVFLLLFSLYGENFMIRSDSPVYIKLAKNLIYHKSFSISENPPLIPNSFRVPLYPIFLAAIFIFTSNLWIVGIIQCFLSALGILYTFKLGEFLGGRKIGTIVALLFGIDFLQLIAPGLIRTQTIFIPIIIASIYYLLVFLKNYKEISLIVSSILLGLAMLTRPVASYLWIFLLLLITFILWKRKVGIFLFKTIFLFLLPLVVIVTPWMIRNQIIFGKFALSSSRDYNLYFWDLSFIHSKNLGLSENKARLYLKEEIKKEFPNIREEELQNLSFSDYFKRRSFQTLKGHTFEYAERHLLGSAYFLISNYYRKIAYITIGSSEENIPVFYSTKLISEGKIFEALRELIKQEKFPIIMTIVGFLISSIYLVFLILNTFFLFKYPNPEYEILLYGIICYFALVSGPISNGSYRHQVLPFIIVLAIIGFFRFFNFAKLRLK